MEIIRDKWAVPHIYANNQTDLFFAQGFVHAQDRLWQMELTKNKSTVLFVNLSLADILLGLTICAVKVIVTFELPPDHILSLIHIYLAASFIQISLLVSILTNIIVTSERQ